MLSITSSCPLVPTGYVHKYHNLHDDHGADLLGVLPDCVDRLGYLLSESGGEAGGKRVLVHCCMGKSRSGAVVVAYGWSTTALIPVIAVLTMMARP